MAGKVPDPEPAFDPEHRKIIATMFGVDESEIFAGDRLKLLRQERRRFLDGYVAPIREHVIASAP